MESDKRLDHTVGPAAADAASVAISPAADGLGRDETIDRRFHALTSRTRRDIVALVWERELPAGSIAAEFDLSAATISEHLSVLREAGLVAMTKAGTSRRYRAVPQAFTGLHPALEAPTKWLPADDIPERDLAEVETRPMVVASVTVPVGPEQTFAAFTDEALYSRWLEVPVRFREGQFAATMEWGTEIRGRYEVLAPPHLIAIAWDFEDQNVPVPGRAMQGYIRVSPDPAGSRVTIHQLVDSPEQAQFMEAAWGVVLGRLRTNLAAVLQSDATSRPRAPRSKRSE